MIRPKVSYGDQEFKTYAEVAEVERDVIVYYDTSPAEPDVNWGGDLNIQSVECDGKDVWSQMSTEERNDLLERLNDHENDRHDPNNDPRY